MVRIFRRDKDANVIEVGTVQVVGGKVKFEGFEDSNFVRWLRRGVQVKGETLTPDDGEDFVENLPLALHGARLWAARGKVS